MAFNIVAGVNNAVYGSVSGSGSYVEGAEVTLEVTANDGYRFVSWDDGSTDNPRIFNASEDVTLVATLEAIPEYVISVTTNDNSLGTVSGSGTFREGTSTQISATPYVHSRFVNWEDGNSDNPRTITVSAAATYKAIFEAVNYFTISTDVNDANLGSVTGAGEYDEGATVTLTAVPETGCRFVGWNDGNTDNPRTFISSANATYTAAFEEIQYTDVTIASNDVSWGTVSGATSGNIETGTTITLTATPATDYKFDGWQVDGEIVSVSPTTSFLVDGQEMDIIAVFSAIVFYQVTLITNDIDCGSISVVSATAEPRGEAHNIWPDGTIINLQAVTTEGGKFLNWSTGQVDTEITVNVHGNETIRANFYPITGLILVTKKILQQTWSTIKSFFSASTGASKIGAPANNALGATTLADVVNSAGQPGGIAMLNNSGKVSAADIDGTLSNDTSGNAATASVADKVGTSTVGSSTEPVYINAGVPTACGNSLAVDITGNAATATISTNSTKVKASYGTSNYDRPILLTGLNNITTTTDNQTTPVYCNKFYANPSTGMLYSTGGFVGNVTGHFTDIIGGRNLLRNTGHTAGGNTTTDGTTITIGTEVRDTYFYLYNAVALTANKIYTISFDVNDLETDKYIKFRVGGTNNSNFEINVNKNGRIYATGFFTSNTNAGAKFILDDIEKDLPSTSFTLTNFKLEEGEQATAYSNAWEDTIPNATNAKNVYQDYGTGNYNRPLLMSSLTNITTTSAQYKNAIFSNNFYANPSTGLLYSKQMLIGKNIGLYSDADGTGESFDHLRLGNATAQGTSGAKSAYLNLYGTGTKFLGIAIGTTNTTDRRLTINSNLTASRAYTLPDADGTLALTSSDITGNAASATKAKVTHTGAAWRDILSCATGFTSASNQDIYGHNSGSVAYYVDANATSGDQRAILRLGNATANTTAAGHNGELWLYSTGTTYNTIKSTCTTSSTITFENNHNITWKSAAAVTLTLPSSTGTLALTSSDITGNAATATTATSATSATDATNSTYSKLTHTVGNSEYPLVFGSSFVITDAQQALRIGTPSATAANCPLRVKAYCAAANTQGEAYLVLGNNLATATANNARGGLVMYGVGTAYNFIKMNTVNTNGKTIFLNTANTADITLTLPSATGTIALTSSNITGSSASCTGNAATATTASACSGNAASATYATNIRVAKSSADSWYYLPFITGATADTNYQPKYHPGLRVDCYDGTTTANGYSFIQLGTSTAFGTAGNAYGRIYFYKKATSTYKTPKRVILTAPDVAAATDSDVTVTLPNATGTLALTSSNITGSSASCTGNAASSTYATNIRVTSTKNNNYYYAVGTSGNAASTNYGPAVFPNIKIRDDTDSTSEVYSRLLLGNSTAKGTSGGKTGCLTLYGNNAKLCNLLGPEGASADCSVRLPKTGGTLALTSDIPSVITPGDYIVETWWGPNYSTTTSNSNTDDSKSTFWYIKFNSGLLIQGCRGFSTSTGSTSVTWKIAFTKAPYLYAGVNTRKTTSGGDSWDYIYSMSTTAATFLHEAGNGFYCIAVGQWK